MALNFMQQYGTSSELAHPWGARSLWHDRVWNALNHLYKQLDLVNYCFSFLERTRVKSILSFF
jgi:hypothetical protein